MAQPRLTLASMTMRCRLKSRSAVFLMMLSGRLYAATGTGRRYRAMPGLTSVMIPARPSRLRLFSVARQKEVDLGESQTGRRHGVENLARVCSYYKLTLNGKDMVEIDTVNLVEMVNGTDMLEEHRQNIGL